MANVFDQFDTKGHEQNIVAANAFDQFDSAPHTPSYLDRVGQAYASSVKPAAAQLMAPFIGEQGRQDLRDAGDLPSEKPATFAQSVNEGPVGAGTGALYSFMAPVAPLISDATNYVAKQVGATPSQMENVQAVMNIAGPAGMRGLGKSLGDMTVGEAANGIKNAVTSAANRLPTIGEASGAAPAVKPLASSQLGDVASFHYGNAERSGVKYTPNMTNALSAAVDRQKITGVQGALQPSEVAFNKSLDFYKQFAGKSLSISDVQALDQQLARLANEYKTNGVIPTQYSNAINGLKYDLRDMAYGDNASKFLSGGDQAGIDSMVAGNKTYVQRGKAIDLEKIINNAALTDNPQKSIRTGIQSLLKNERKMKFYTDADKAALLKAKGTGVLGGLTSILGNGTTDVAIGTVGGAVGGGLPGAVGGAIAGKIISKPFAAAGEAIQSARLNKALEKIQANLPEATPAVPSGAVTPPQLALTYRPPATTYGVHPADLPPTETVINVEGPRIPQLPAPGTRYAPSPRDMTASELAISRAKMRGGKLPTPPVNQAVIRPPVSQLAKITDSLGKTRGKEFNDLTRIFLDGDMSQNAFISDVINKYKLSTTQARSLANELKTYGPKLTKQDLQKAFEAKKGTK